LYEQIKIHTLEKDSYAQMITFYNM
jgi:hypothetical protein